MSIIMRHRHARVAAAALGRAAVSALLLACGTRPAEELPPGPQGPPPTSTTPPPAGSGSAPAPDTGSARLPANFPSGNEATDRATLERMKQQTRALARTGGCAAAGDCAAQPLGVRACGGPSEYVVHCPRTTDVAALRSAAAAVEQAERAFNARYGLVSTCEVIMPPALGLVDGQCRDVTPPGGNRVY
jgi:hypothetical protein